MFDIQQFADNFRQIYGDEPKLFSAPGRVNLIGEHTDYNQGFVLPFAIQQRTYVACSRREDRQIDVTTATLDQRRTFVLDEQISNERDWTTYVSGMFVTLGRRGISTSGMNVLIDSDIPFGAGLSSSAALEIAVGTAVVSLSDVTIDPLDLALAAQEVEHVFVGVRSGLMDQLASALSRLDNVMLIDCRTNQCEHVPLELDDLVLVVCDSRVKHELAASEYNQRREECELGVRLLRDHLPDVESVRDVTAGELERYSSYLPQNVLKRCHHVIHENQRVLDSVDAIKARDFNKLGRLMVESHKSLRDDYEVSCRELDLLVDTASSVPGVKGSRMTGGGFGGCTITLSARESLNSFMKAVNAAYQEEFQKEPAIFTVYPDDGVKQEVLT
ncbi:MAG: galactokinase [Pyrinomonadaceae bacterium]